MKKILQLFYLSLILFSALIAQDIVVKGLVRDGHNHQPLAMVNIVSGEIGTTTDEDGRFEIAVDRDALLTFSHIGYETITSAARADLTVSLKKIVLKGAPVLVSAARAVAGVTPISFSNLTAEEIKTRYTVEDLPMILASEPGVWAYSESGNGTGYSYVSIRGFDQSRIAVMLDNVPLNDNESHQVYWVDHGDILSDAKDVQIQRGIGNSLYGSSAFGGSINVNTQIVSDKRVIRGQVGSGSFNTSKYQLKYKSGQDLGENMNLTLRVSQIQSDGYREEHQSLQKSLFFGLEHRRGKITNQFRALIGYENTHLLWDGVYMTDIEDRTKRRAGYKSFTDNFLQQIYSLNSFFPLRENLYFKNVSYLVMGQGYFEVFKTGRDFYSYNLDKNDQYSDKEEQSLTTDLLRRKWIVNHYYGIIPTFTWDKKSLRLDMGGEFRFYTGDHFGEVTDFSDPALVTTLGKGWYRYYRYLGQKNSVTGFVHLVLSPENAPFIIMADLQTQNHRWTLDQETIGHAAGHKLSADWDFLNPRFGMVWHFGDSLFAFVNYGKAQKEPADNQIIQADDVWSEPTMAAAEVINDWEMGLNITFGKGRGSINYYRINYLNEQLKNIDIEQEGEYEFSAADSTTHQGIEWEFKHTFNPRLSINANGAVILNTFTNGKNLPNIPASLLNLSLNYHWRKNLIVFAHYRSVGHMYVDNDNRDEGLIKPYTLLDVGALYQWKDLEVKVKINNVFDKLYSTFGYAFEWDGYHAYYWPGATRNSFISISYTM